MVASAVILIQAAIIKEDIMGNPKSIKIESDNMKGNTAENIDIMSESYFSELRSSFDEFNPAINIKNNIPKSPRISIILVLGSSKVLRI